MESNVPSVKNVSGKFHHKMVLRRKIVSHITDRYPGSLGDSSEGKARETFFY